MKPGWLGLAGLVAVAACSAPDHRAGAPDENALTDITPSDGVQQTISDCWDFASSGWIETLSRRPNGATPVDISEGLVSYLHWYRQIVDPKFTSLSVLGSWGRAVELLRRYGWMSETEFLSQTTATHYAARHAEALAAIQVELRGGDLATPAQRADHANVVAVLNRVWQLAPDVVADLTRAYGAAHEKAQFDFTGTRLRTLHAIPVGTAADGTPLTAADLVGTPADPNQAFNGVRVGPHAWSVVTRPTDDAGLRDYFRRAEKALLQGMPVPISLMSDPTQDDATGTFQAPASGTLVNPAGHLVMVFDMTVQTPDFGLLPAGVPETRPDALAETLRDDATVVSFRARNSLWGDYKVPGQTIPSVPGMVGVNDFTTAYLSMRLPVTPDNPSGMALRTMVLPNDPDQTIGK